MDTARRKPVKKLSKAPGAKQYIMIAAAVLALLLLLLTIIGFNRAAQSDRAYRQSRAQVGGVIEQQINLFIRTYESMSLAGADVQNTLLPQLKLYLHGMEQLDDALSYAYGSSWSLLSTNTRELLNDALDAYDEAYRFGKTTDSAYAKLTQAVETLTAIRNARYDNNGTLLQGK